MTGEPGSGKTGVVDAFLERVASDPRVWTGQGQCVAAYGLKNHIRRYLTAALGFARLEPRARPLVLLHRWLDTWMDDRG